MLEFLTSRGLLPHGYCLQWQPQLLWTHVGADIAIAIAYFSIPAMILYYLRRRTTIAEIPGPYLLIGLLFAAFIVFCGLTHVFGLITIWRPYYGMEAAVKTATALVSLLTAVVMIPVLPRALALRTPEELERINASLEAEIARGVEREQELKSRNQQLREEMAARTQAEAAQQAAIRARDELQRAMDQLRLTQARLVESEKLASMGKSMAGIAHEVNTPVGVSITAVSTLADATARIRDDFSTERLSQGGLRQYLATAGDSLDIVGRNLERAAGLLQSIKQVATDQSSDQPRNIALEEYIQVVLRSLKPKLMAGRIPVQVQCPPDLTLYTLPGALSQVIINLVSNAMLHAFPEPRSGEIRLQARPANGLVQLICEDNGIGIEPAHLKRIFEPFFTTRASDGGSGIGLDIVKMLVTEKLKGSIDVHSVPGQGSRFQVVLRDLRQESGAQPPVLADSQVNPA